MDQIGAGLSKSYRSLRKIFFQSWIFIRQGFISSNGHIFFRFLSGSSQKSIRIPQESWKNVEKNSKEYESNMPFVWKKSFVRSTQGLKYFFRRLRHDYENSYPRCIILGFLQEISTLWLKMNEEYRDLTQTLQRPYRDISPLWQ